MKSNRPPSGHRKRSVPLPSANRTPSFSVSSVSQHWKGHFRETVALALPLVLAQVAMIAIWTSDVIMMGWIGSEDLAAGIQANRLYQPFFFVAIGLTTAVSPLIAQALGARSRRQARRVVRQGMWLALFCGALSIVPMWNGETLLLLLGQEETIASNAAPFLRMMAMGMIPIYAYFVLRHYISAHKKTVPPLVVTLIGVGLNIGLNFVLSRGLLGAPVMGISGIGLATSITFLTMVVMLVVYINTTPPFRYTRPFARLWQMDTAVMRRLLVVGYPIAFTLLCETGMFIFIGLYIGIFGTHAVAASGITNQLAALFFMVPLAIGQATTIRVGHEAGAGRRVDTLRAGFTPMILATVVCLASMAILLLLAEPLARLFLNPKDGAVEAVVALAIPMLLVVALFQVFDGLQVVFASALRGLNDTKLPALLSFLAYWGVGVPMAVILATPLGLGPAGVWWGVLLGLFVGTIMLGWRCAATWRRLRDGGPILLA